MSVILRIFVDGSGKTGKYVFLVEETNEIKVFEKKGITNNEAEYLSVIEALKNFPNENEITIFSDSKLVVNQLNHEYAIKEERLRELAEKVWKLCERKNVKFVWISRERNKAGKFLG